MDKGIRVLVVDDFKTMRKIIRNCLGQLGFKNVKEAPDGKEALQMLREPGSSFGLIISDWNMPSMPGIELLREVRADNNLKKIPFVMVTAEGQKENILDAAKAGVSQYVIKPFTPEILQEKLLSVLQ